MSVSASELIIRSLLDPTMGRKNQDQGMVCGGWRSP